MQKRVAGLWAGVEWESVVLVLCEERPLCQRKPMREIAKAALPMRIDLSRANLRFARWLALSRRIQNGNRGDEIQAFNGCN